jgi:serine/threonine protein kinase
VSGAASTSTRTLDRYALDALIGKGGMAEVYLAHVRAGSPLAGHAVAVKRLLPSLAKDPAYVALFEQEAQITRRLRHPNIVEVIDTGVAGDTPFIVMDYVDGKNLRQILSQCATRKILLPVDFAAYVAHVVSQALAHAHTGRDEHGRPLGIIHCDVSPSNVFVSKMGAIKLGDFGVALTPGAARGIPPAFGKAHYLSEEQILGRPPTPQTDIFALGAMLFELFTNEKAFPGTNLKEVGQRILDRKIRVPSELRPEVPFALDEVVLRCLSPSVENRYDSAAAVAEDLATRYDPSVGNPLAIAAVVRGLFGVK